MIYHITFPPHSIEHANQSIIDIKVKRKQSNVCFVQ